MKKLLLIIVILLLCSCNEKSLNKFSLDEKYYDNGGFEVISLNDLMNLEDEKGNFLLFVYTPYCSYNVPCDLVFEQFAKDNNIKILKISYDDFKKSSYSNTVKYAPTVIILNDGNIITYLDPDKNEDIELYQDLNKFSLWINKYVSIE